MDPHQLDFSNLTAEDAGFLRDVCAAQADHWTSRPGCEAAMRQIAGIFATLTERVAAEEGVPPPGSREFGRDAFSFTVERIDTQIIDDVAGQIVKLADWYQSKQFTAGAHLCNKIAQELAAIVQDRRATMAPGELERMYGADPKPEP